MLRTVSIGKRIIALLAILFLFIIATGAAFFFNSESVKGIGIEKATTLMLEGQKAKLEVSTNALATAISKTIADIPDMDQRVTAIRKALNDIRFEEDKSGYYFVFDGTMTIAHAANPSLNGKDLGELKDKNGIFMIRKLSRTAANGGGFVHYIWPKPDMGDQPKLSYATLIPGTNYTIGTGVYIDNIDHEEEAISREMDSVVARNILMVVVGLAVALIGIIVPLSIFVVRSITHPLAEATKAAESIARGDYSVKLDVKGNDEASTMQQSLNAMAATLRENMEKISSKTCEAQEKAQAAEQAMLDADEARRQAERAKQEGSRQAALRIQNIVNRISDASDHISSQASVIAQGTTVQRDRVQGTAAAMEEMNATVLEVARNASEASTMGHQARDNAVQGAGIVRQSVDAMNQTFTAAATLKSDMNKLGDQADAIGEVMTVITDIADQTNLLALNAAIEAARAGEAGRGFAVVADEVRKLAEKTMQATKEVGSSISSVQNVAKQNISGMEAAISDLNRAVELSNRSGEVLNEIVKGAEASAMQIQSIATAAEQQSATSDEINSAIEEINAISLETSQGVSESTDAIRELTVQMRELQGIIDSLMAEAQ